LISSRQPFQTPRIRLLKRSRRSWLQRFWNVEELFELKVTLLLVVSALGAALGA